MRYQLPGEIADWYTKQADDRYTSRSAYLRALAIEGYRRHRTEHDGKSA